MQKWSAVKERGGMLPLMLMLGFLPFGWALAVPSHLILCDFMVLALFQYCASSFSVCT